MLEQSKAVQLASRAAILICNLLYLLCRCAVACRYILKCISQYGDNQFYGKFKQLYPDNADIVTQIPSAGRNRRITIGPRPPPELDPSPRTVVGSGRPAVISDFVEVSIERTFVAKLCYVAEDLFPVGTMQLRLLQHVDATGNQFTTRWVVCLHTAVHAVRGVTGGSGICARRAETGYRIEPCC